MLYGSQADAVDWPDAPPFVSALSINYAKELGKFDRSRLHREL